MRSENNLPEPGLLTQAGKKKNHPGISLAWHDFSTAQYAWVILYLSCLCAVPKFLTIRRNTFLFLEKDLLLAIGTGINKFLVEKLIT